MTVTAQGKSPSINKVSSELSKTSESKIELSTANQDTFHVCDAHVDKTPSVFSGTGLLLPELPLPPRHRLIIPEGLFLPEEIVYSSAVKIIRQKWRWASCPSADFEWRTVTVNATLDIVEGISAGPSPERAPPRRNRRSPRPNSGRTEPKSLLLPGESPPLPRCPSGDTVPRVSWRPRLAQKCEQMDPSAGRCPRQHGNAPIGQKFPRVSLTSGRTPQPQGFTASAF